MLEKFKKYRTISLILYILTFLIAYGLIATIIYNPDEDAFVNFFISLLILLFLLGIFRPILLKFIRNNYRKWLEINIKLEKGIDDIITLFFYKSYLTSDDIDNLKINKQIIHYIKNYNEDKNKFNDDRVKLISKQNIYPVRMLNFSIWLFLLLGWVLLIVFWLISLSNIINEMQQFRVYSIIISFPISGFLYFKYIYGGLLRNFIDKKTMLGINKRGIIYLGSKYEFDEIIIPNSLIEFTTKNDINYWNYHVNFELELKNGSDKLQIDFVDKSNTMYRVSNALYHYKMKSQIRIK